MAKCRDCNGSGEGAGDGLCRACGGDGYTDHERSEYAPEPYEWDHESPGTGDEFTLNEFLKTGELR